MVDRRQEKHVAAFDERLGDAHPISVLTIIPSIRSASGARIERHLHGAVNVSVKTAHRRLPFDYAVHPQGTAGVRVIVFILASG